MSTEKEDVSEKEHCTGENSALALQSLGFKACSGLNVSDFSHWTA